MNIKVTILVLLSLFLFLPALCNPLLEEAKTLYAESESSAAAALYRDLIEEGNENARLEMGLLFKEQGNYEKALFYLTPLAKGKNNQTVRLLTAEILYLNGSAHEALAMLKSIPNDKNNYLVNLYQALCYEEMNKTDSALIHYQNSLNKQKTSIALYRLGKIFYRAKQYKKAIQYFEKLLSFDASIRLTHYYLGKCFLKLKNTEEAYAAFSKAHMLYPAQAGIKKELDAAKKKLGQAYFVKKKKELEKKRKELVLGRYEEVQMKAPLVTVRILDDVKSFRFKCEGAVSFETKTKTFSLKKNIFYTVRSTPNGITVMQDGSKRLLNTKSFWVKLRSQNYPFYIVETVQGKNQFWQSLQDTAYRGSLVVKSARATLSVSNEINIEEYLYSVLPSEIYPTAHTEALKAQAVAARTIAYRNIGRHKKNGFDFCANVHCQAYRGYLRETEKTNKAVDATQGEIITYNGEPVEAFYHSNCGGCLESSLFGKKEYLKNKLDTEKNNEKVFSPFDTEMWFKNTQNTFCSRTKRAANFRWQRMYDKEDFAMLFGYPLNSVTSIIISKKRECNHADTVVIAREKSKKTIRKDLNIRKYFDDLRSSAFIIEIKYRKEKEKRYAEAVLIWGAGFGHGVGMCQEGALSMAEQGHTYKEILTHYYPNSHIAVLHQKSGD